ncbi:iron-sulfur cluster assembly accessory protein [Trichothermofontia sichuanensis B231]|uniref:HesB/IscA family protein n=1 Tax=Trichothermofontia sichuanensis TaxID=3045816 RepID=UPI0022464581|nr:iron-sulfur cluster assembly accessory protein [Trichothermofontia sichuanensis]UZQ53445.1 iron-sulfur cluster assembly accessory protein [Trichothermofontia sichuanensis B231]
MIQITPAAASELKRLQAKQASPTARLRLKVEAGGCAGLYYALSFDETLNAQDQVGECQGIATVVDLETQKHIEGLVLDYTEDLMGGGFRFHNPKAVQSCGCGHSFALA